MGDKSAIEWTRGEDGIQGATWNPIYAVNKQTGKRGWFCIHASDGCRECYAAKMNLWRGNGFDYVAKNLEHVEIKINLAGKGDSSIDWPIRARRPRKIFPCSMTDLFAEFIPDSFIDQVMAVCWIANWHTYEILTKRVDRASRYFADPQLPERLVDAVNLIHDRYIKSLEQAIYLAGEVELPFKNVWLGASVEDQKMANERRRPLKQLAEQGWLTWVSYEPALGDVDWAGWKFIDWLVAGGESGRKARPSHPITFRRAREFCLANRIPFFFKQHGEWLHQVDAVPSSIPTVDLLTARVHDWLDQSKSYRVGKKAAGAMLDGIEWREFP